FLPPQQSDDSEERLEILQRPDRGDQGGQRMKNVARPPRTFGPAAGGIAAKMNIITMAIVPLAGAKGVVLGTAHHRVGDQMQHFYFAGGMFHSSSRPRPGSMDGHGFPETGKVIMHRLVKS